MQLTYESTCGKWWLPLRNVVILPLSAFSHPSFLHSRSPPLQSLHSLNPSRLSLKPTPVYPVSSVMAEALASLAGSALSTSQGADILPTPSGLKFSTGALCQHATFLRGVTSFLPESSGN